MEKYRELKCIGRGSYGSAHLVQEISTNEKYVIKKIPMELLTEKEKKQAFEEVKLLSKLKHPNVVEYKENFVQENIIHIVMGYCDGGDLAGKIREKKEQNPGSFFEVGQILDWFVQMAMAIKYLHQQHILHRDLKTSNIFLTKHNVVKLGDFGIAKSLDSTLDQAKTIVGTPYYMSPEVCESKPYSYSSDVWSLGCVLYEMCALKHAFDAPNILTLILKIVQQEFAPLPDFFDSGMCEILKKLLDKDPEKRPSIDQIFSIPYIRHHMKGLVISGGSFGVEAARKISRNPVRNVIGKRRVVMPKSSNNLGSLNATPPTLPPPAPAGPSLSMWSLMVPEESDNDESEGLETSILEESHLANELEVRLPERSSTPEPLVLPPPPPALIVPKPVLRVLKSDAIQAYLENAVEDQSEEITEEVVEEEDTSACFQEEMDEVMMMNIDYQNEYSEECMDSLQIYYQPQDELAIERRTSFKSTASPGKSEEFLHLRIKNLNVGSVCGQNVKTPAKSESETKHNSRKYSEVSEISDGLGISHIEESSEVILTQSGILSEQGNVAATSVEGTALDEESGDDYTSASEYECDEAEYEADENFYSDHEKEVTGGLREYHHVALDKTLIVKGLHDKKEARTPMELGEYSDDFEESDEEEEEGDEGEIFEYSNDEFEEESLGGALTLTPSKINTSPRKKDPVIDSEVHQVMRNVARSLLESQTFNQMQGVS